MNEKAVRDDEVEIDLAEVFHILLRKWWLIAVVAIVCAAGAFGITKVFMTPKYQSSAKLYILNKTTSVTSLADIQIGSAITKDFKIIAESKPVIDYSIQSIKEEYGKEFTRGDISSSLTVTNQSDTRILVITITREDPEEACIMANAVSEATSKRMSQIMKSDPPTTVEMAEVSSVPVSPHTRRNVILGFLLGAVAVCAVLIIHHMMNDNIKTEEDVERFLGVPTLATLPLIKGKSSKKEELVQTRKASGSGKKKEE